MAWLATLDTKAARASKAIRWPYLALRWFLIVMGVYLVIGLAVIEIQEGRIGLGTGTTAALLVVGVKGVLLARAGPSRPPPDAQESN